MVTGTIKWFGGKTNEGHKNNYGFIIRDGQSEQKEIYIKRDQVPFDLQEFCDNDPQHGAGIFVEFEFKETSQGLQVVNLRLYEEFGIIVVNKFNRLNKYIECEDNQIISNSNIYNLKEGDIVKFGIRDHKLGFKYKKIVQLNPIVLEETPIEILERYSKVSNSKITTSFLIAYISKLSIEEAIHVFIQNKNTLLGKNKKLPFNKIQVFFKESFQKSYDIRELLFQTEIKEYIRLLSDSLTCGSTPEILCQQLLEELISFLEQLSEPQQYILWNQIPYLQEKLEYKNILWKIAPANLKKQIIQSHCALFFSLVQEFNESGYLGEEFISVNYKDLYKFDSTDETLIQKWDSRVLYQPDQKARMLSARGAEKLVINLYEKTGNAIEDISIHQVTKKTVDWKKADIKVNSNIYIDVKNARSEVNSNVYSEFCIPQFKKDRNYQNVFISAVLSPYLQSEYLEGEKEANFRVKDPIYLGNLDYSKLSKIREHFQDEFIEIKLYDSSEKTQFFPPWVFDYGTSFYKAQIGVSKKLKSLNNHDIPEIEDISILEKDNIYTYLPLFIYSNRQIPENWFDRLSIWETSFIELLYRKDGDRLTLPFVYLAILKHFLMMLSNNDDEFSPIKYQLILNGHSTLRSSSPLKIYDPLNIIEDFCKTLEVLWHNRSQTKINQFKIFKFNGKGWLQGKILKEDDYTTIIAYCGGQIEGKGACGYSPLIIGREKTCDCGKLICPGKGENYCGFCGFKNWADKIPCPSYKKRKSLQKN